MKRSLLTFTLFLSMASAYECSSDNYGACFQIAETSLENLFKHEYQALKTSHQELEKEIMNEIVEEEENSSRDLKSVAFINLNSLAEKTEKCQKEMGSFLKIAKNIKAIWNMAGELEVSLGKFFPEKEFMLEEPTESENGLEDSSLDTAGVKNSEAGYEADSEGGTDSEEESDFSRGTFDLSQSLDELFISPFLTDSEEE